jgi:hypothetical protein
MIDQNPKRVDFRLKLNINMRLLIDIRVKEKVNSFKRGISRTQYQLCYSSV